MRKQVIVAAFFACAVLLSPHSSAAEDPRGRRPSHPTSPRAVGTAAPARTSTPIRSGPEERLRTNSERSKRPPVTRKHQQTQGNRAGEKGQRAPRSTSGCQPGSFGESPFLFTPEAEIPAGMEKESDVAADLLAIWNGPYWVPPPGGLTRFLWPSPMPINFEATLLRTPPVVNSG